MKPTHYYNTSDREEGIVEVDSLDLAAFDECVYRFDVLGRLIEQGTPLLPTFRSLALDLFAALYKYNVVVSEETVELAGFRIHREVVGWLMASPDLDRLKRRTFLEADLSAYIVGKLLAAFLRIITREEVVSSDELLDEWEIHRAEEEVGELDEQLDVLEELGVSGEDEDRNELRERVKQRLDSQRRETAKRLEQLRSQQEDWIDSMPLSGKSDLRSMVSSLPDAIDRQNDAVESFGHGLGYEGSKIPASVKLHLGEKLLSSEKLHKLARLAGAFRDYARAQRQSRFERIPNEVHDIDLGRDLARLLPSELIYLSHPMLRRHFLRRFLDGELMQYAIRGDEKRGRGPMVIGLDASSSMQGEKEIWSKAIALTLLSIARKERRAFHAVVFSSRQAPLHAFRLLEPAPIGCVIPADVDATELVRFAECFPGGGTDFEQPLDECLNVLTTSRFKNGDIIFITDGQAPISPPWQQQFKAVRDELRFKLHTILIDVGAHKAETIVGLSDSVTRVSDLTAESVADLFRDL